MRFFSMPARRTSKGHSSGLAARRARHARGARRLAVERLEGRQLLSAGGWVANSVAAPGSSDPGRSLALDAEGNVYVAGTYSGTQQFGGTTLTSSGSRDIFISKFNPDGQFVWTVSAGGAGDEGSPQIAVDGNDNVYVIADFGGSANFGGTTLVSEGARSMVAARIGEADGAFHWATRLGREAAATGVVVDAQGQLTVAGQFSGTATFGQFQLTSQGSDGFLARLDPASGNVDWVRQFTSGGTGFNNNGGMAVDSGGNIYVATSLELRKFDSEGQVQWNQPTRNGEGGAIAIYEQGGTTYIYTQDVLNGLDGQRKFQDLGSGAQEVWVRQLDPQYGRAGSGFGMAIDAFGNNYAMGADRFGGFYWVLDVDGNTVSLHHVTGPYPLGEEVFTNDIAVDPAGNIYTTGHFYISNQLFDTGTALVPPSSPTNGMSMYLLKSTQDRASVYGKAFNDLNNDGLWQFQDLDGNGYWSGNDTGEPSLPSAKVYADLNQNGQWDQVEPWTTTEAGGEYLLRHVAPGAHTVRLVSPPGFAPSAAFANGVSIVAEAGESNLDIELGAHTASTWRTYTSSDVPKSFPSRGFQHRDSLLSVTGDYRAFGLEATVSLTSPRTVTLIAPDGTATSIAMPSGQTTVTVYRNDFNQKPVLGTWTLRLQGSDGAPSSTLTAWSLRILGPASPPVPPGITVSPVSGLVTTENLGTANFTVVLRSQPAADVTIPLSSSDTTEGTVSVSSLTFTPANWNQPQTVTVRGVNDLLVDGTIAYSVVTDPAVSGDPNYHGLNASNVAVSNTDNDKKGRLLLKAAARGRDPGAADLGQAELAPIAAAAKLRWAAAGADLARLDDVEIAVAQLPGRTLGRADGRTIWIDTNAADWGWFVDRTPGRDSEFSTRGNQGERNRIDLLTVVMHEMGHLLGLDHGDEHDLMAETLAPGARSTDIQPVRQSVPSFDATQNAEALDEMVRWLAFDIARSAASDSDPQTSGEKVAPPIWATQP